MSKVKEVLGIWAKEMIKTSICLNIDKIEKDLVNSKLDARNAGGDLRGFKIANIISKYLPISSFLTLNNEIVLTNDHLFDLERVITDRTRDSLNSLLNELMASIEIPNRAKGEDQMLALESVLVLGHSKAKATKENKVSLPSLEIVNKEPILLAVYTIAMYKEYIFSLLIEIAISIYEKDKQ